VSVVQFRPWAPSFFIVDQPKSSIVKVWRPWDPVLDVGHPASGVAALRLRGARTLLVGSSQGSEPADRKNVSRRLSQPIPSRAAAALDVLAELMLQRVRLAPASRTMSLPLTRPVGQSDHGRWPCSPTE
jgi:hypothetical protein